MSPRLVAVIISTMLVIPSLTIVEKDFVDVDVDTNVGVVFGGSRTVGSGISDDMAYTGKSRPARV